MVSYCFLDIIRASVHKLPEINFTSHLKYFYFDNENFFINFFWVQSLTKVSHSVFERFIVVKINGFWWNFFWINYMLGPTLWWVGVEIPCEVGELSTQFCQRNWTRIFKLWWMETKLDKKWLDTCIFVSLKYCLSKGYSPKYTKNVIFQKIITF